MNKLFKPKAMRRLLLFMALIFPVVYLCGGLFFALNGAHGQTLFVDGNDNSYVVSSNTINGKYYTRDGALGNWDKAISYDVIELQDGFSYSVNKPDTDLPLSGVMSCFFDENGAPSSYSEFYGTISFPYSIPANGASVGLTFISSSVVGLGSFVGSYVVTSDFIVDLNFSDYLFSEPFVSNNFISQLGLGIIGNSNDGFAPMNQLFYTINQNILHFGQNDKLAVFGYGYVYYAVNVLIIYEVVILAVKLIMLPLKAVEVFDAEER